MSAAQLLAESTGYDQLSVTERGRTHQGVADLVDLRFASAFGDLAAATLVVPEAGPPTSGILFLHWLGPELSTRREFESEAVGLAAHGAASLLLQESFPWTTRATGSAHDRVAIGRQVRTIRRALTVLRHTLPVGPISVVGHDFGGLYAMVVAAVDSRVTSLVAMAATGAWANWFVPYYHADGGDESAYRAALLDLDPVTLVPSLTDPVLLQFSSNDPFVSAAAAHTLTDAFASAEVHSYAAGHALDAGARSGRDAWLAKTLGWP